MKKEEAVVHHVHHKEETVDEYKREVTIQGINITVSLSSNFPKENIDFLIDKALSVLSKVKEVDNK